MKIAQVAPLFESVPPQCYGGTERVVSYLTEELVRQGHHLIVCEAVGIDPAWYQGRATEQNSLPRATPP